MHGVIVRDAVAVRRVHFGHWLVERVLTPYVDDLFHGFEDVDGGDEEREILFRETSDVGHHGGHFKSTQDDHKDAYPNANPQSKSQVIVAIGLAKVVQDPFEDQDGSGRVQEGQRLSSKEGVEPAMQKVIMDQIKWVKS